MAVNSLTYACPASLIDTVSAPHGFRDSRSMEFNAGNAYALPIIRQIDDGIDIWRFKASDKTQVPNLY